MTGFGAHQATLLARDFFFGRFLLQFAVGAISRQDAQACALFAVSALQSIAFAERVRAVVQLAALALQSRQMVIHFLQLKKLRVHNFSNRVLDLVVLKLVRLMFLRPAFYEQNFQVGDGLEIFRSSCRAFGLNELRQIEA
jgi:hypothetical protein